ncbi:MAG: hypothetical protein N2Z74_04905 [Syntrophales bacterium]|nr:hypothetical protein [Syntrophales bacterium]
MPDSCCVKTTMVNNEGKRTEIDVDLILARKAKAAALLLSVTEEMQHVLAEDRIRDLLPLINRRGEIMRVIDILDHAVEAKRSEQDINILPHDSVETLGQIQATLAKIAIENERCMTMLTSRCYELKRDIALLIQEEEGVRGYQTGNCEVPRFLNIKS